MYKRFLLIILLTTTNLVAFSQQKGFSDLKGKWKDIKHLPTLRRDTQVYIFINDSTVMLTHTQNRVKQIEKYYLQPGVSSGWFVFNIKSFAKSSDARMFLKFEDDNTIAVKYDLSGKTTINDIENKKKDTYTLKRVDTKDYSALLAK